MANTTSMWDLTSCLDFAVTCRQSEERKISNRGLRPVVCPRCEVDLSKPYQVLYGAGKTASTYDAASFEFKPLNFNKRKSCPHELHEFARKTVLKGLKGSTPQTAQDRLTGFSSKSTSSIGLRGGGLETAEHEFRHYARKTTTKGLRGGDPKTSKRPAVERTNTLGGDFSPVIKVVTPATPDSLLTEGLFPLDEGYSSTGQNSRRTSDVSAPGQDTDATSQDAEFREIASLLKTLMSGPSKKDAAFAHLVGLGFNKAIVEELQASFSVAEILPIQPAHKEQKKVRHCHRIPLHSLPSEQLANSRAQLDLKESLVTAPRDVVEISNKSVAKPIAHAIAEAAVLAVAAANAAWKARELKTTPLTPASIVTPPNLAKSPVELTVPHDIKDSNGYKKLTIASKLVTTLGLNPHGTDCGDLFKALKDTDSISDSESGIHVFIDASNIEIGFMNALKAASGIPKDSYADGKGAFLFESLALILERGRKVAKRELVGSCQDNGSSLAPYMDDAKVLGYNVSAPQVVKKWKEIQTRGHTQAGDDDWTGKPEYKVRWTMKQKNTEQLVDELIHLKMADSMLDADTPGTMVLATGDANVAEYSNGFFAYVERALRKGWKVELVTWKDSMATAYNKLKKTNAWGDQFMIIELDEFRAELTNASKQGDWWKSN